MAAGAAATPTLHGEEPVLARAAAGRQAGRLLSSPAYSARTGTTTVTPSSVPELELGAGGAPGERAGGFCSGSGQEGSKMEPGLGAGVVTGPRLRTCTTRASHKWMWVGAGTWDKFSRLSLPHAVLQTALVSQRPRRQPVRPVRATCKVLGIQYKHLAFVYTKVCEAYLQVCRTRPSKLLAWVNIQCLK